MLNELEMPQISVSIHPLVLPLIFSLALALSPLYMFQNIETKNPL